MATQRKAKAKPKPEKSNAERIVREQKGKKRRTGTRRSRPGSQWCVSAASAYSRRSWLRVASVSILAGRKVGRQAAEDGKPKARQRSAGRRSSVFRSSDVAGLAVRLTVGLADGSTWDVSEVELSGLIARPKGPRKPSFPGLRDTQRAVGHLVRGVRPNVITDLLAALAHPQRLTILIKLLGGEATHKLLAKATGLKPGPLYHHIRELRVAMFIGPKQRDLYRLTPKGRRAILAALAMGALCRR